MITRETHNLEPSWIKTKLRLKKGDLISYVFQGDLITTFLISDVCRCNFIYEVHYHCLNNDHWKWKYFMIDSFIHDDCKVIQSI